MRHPTESALLSFARGQSNAAAAGVAAHLDSCLACRVWETRLRNAWVAEADGPVTARLTAAAQAIPENLRKALAVAPGAAVPAAGDIWRVGSDEALLVWVRRIASESAVVIPVTLDVELADQYTLIVPAGESPLGLDLALMTTAEGHVDRSAFLQQIAALPVGDQITQLVLARGDGRPPPPGLLTGSPASGDDDQRQEYRQHLADLLAGLAPGARPDAGRPGSRDVGVDVDRLAAVLNGLTWHRPGLEISLLDRGHVAVGPAHELIVTALVRDLDAAILVAVLTGPEPARVLSAPEVARACGGLLTMYQDADDVAVAVPDQEWTAVVVTPEFASRAVEAPSGRLSGPRVAFQPLPLADALLKHLDSRVTRWEQTGRLRFDRDAVDLAALAAAVSQAAVDRAVARGRSARIPAKKAAYTALDDSAVAGIRTLIESVVAAGASPVDGVTALMSGVRR
ncbi:MAG TPA: hypothetical protein VIV12_22565 [Streptosporangiaceae bacterium]